MNRWKTVGIAIALLAAVGVLVVDLWPKAEEAIAAPRPAVTGEQILQFDSTDI